MITSHNLCEAPAVQAGLRINILTPPPPPPGGCRARNAADVDPEQVTWSFQLILI